MVNKDQLDQSPEGQQVLALLAANFSADQFQPALTLIEQRYTEDQTVWDHASHRLRQQGWPRRTSRPQGLRPGRPRLLLAPAGRSGRQSGAYRLCRQEPATESTVASRRTRLAPGDRRLFS